MTAPLGRLAAALADRYRLDRELGAGGMATVYLAHDLKHDRRVAVKVLRPELAAVIGAERFLAEIRTTANLQHPHILPLFDSGAADGFLFYVMPYVEGVSLRDRITREHQLPVDDAVRLAREVASALDYAHRHGVIHRDIKPENILLHDGSALVADFGIALAVSTAGSRMTETGMSLGTPHYMSPEQAMGEREITARSDVYALGCVTYEMLVGEPPFTGPTAQAIIARVMTEEPRPLTTQRKHVAPAVEDAVFRALEKLPADRFATAAEFSAALAADRPGAATRIARSRATRAPGASPVGAQPWSQGVRWAWVPALAAGLLLGLALRRHAPVSAPPLQASLLAPSAKCDFADIGSSNLIQLSPDGSTVAFVALCDGARALWTRDLATGAAHQLGGTVNALYPFWSYDGRSLGFFAEGRLKRIDLASGAVRDLAPALNGRGGAWNRDGVILYAPDVYSPLFRVPAGGGTPQQVTTLQKGDQITHRLPYFMPDGEHFLFSEGRSAAWDGAVLAGRLTSRDTHHVLETPSNVALSHDRLFFMRDGALYSQPFAVRSLTVTGSASAVVPGVETWPFKYLGNFSVVGGVLVYRLRRGQQREMDWFDPASHTSVPAAEAGPYLSADVSPDGKQLLVIRSSSESPLADVWIYTSATEAWTRFTTHPDQSYTAAWSPDGSLIALKAANDSVTHVISADRREVATYDVSGPGVGPIESWGRDGSFALGTRQVRATGIDLTRISLGTAGAKAEPLYATTADESSPLISPSGKLVAYLSNQSGRMEVYLMPLADPTVHWPVSQDGALSEETNEARALAWAPDGRTIYFIDARRRLMSAAIADGSPVSIGKPAQVRGAPEAIASLSRAPDGRLLIVRDNVRDRVPLTVLANWPATLAER